MPEAIAAFQNAIACEAEFASAYHNLALALYSQKQLPAAIAAYRKAIALELHDATLHYNLGNALREQKDLPGAIEQYREAIALDRQYAEAHCNLGLGLRLQGHFSQALVHLKQGHELGSQRKDWPYPSGQWVRLCERQAEFAARLPALVKGEYQPKDNPERGELIEVCRLQQRYQTAARLFTDAFAVDPKLADRFGTRYNAACFAALAAAGQGKDEPPTDEKEPAKLRTQALAWLRADVVAQSKTLTSNPSFAVALRNQLKHWQTDPDLVAVRDNKELSRLPQEEQAAWQKLWTDVEHLRTAARSNYTKTTFKGTLTAKEGQQVHELKMLAGKTYVIDMSSPQFDTYLRLEDDKGKVVAENDDISPTNLNSRIVFTAPKDGAYRIVAT